MAARTACRIALVVAALAFSRGVAAQSYLVHSYTEIDGLPSYVVHDITQDRRGRMWFATKAGVCVYDGSTFETFAAESGLPAVEVVRVTTDPAGHVWALPGGSDPFLAWYDGERWHAVPGPGGGRGSGIEVTSLAADTVGGRIVVAIGTRRHGVLLYGDGGWTTVSLDRGLPSVHVREILAWAGRFYVATARGLAVIDGWSASTALQRLVERPTEPILGISAVGPGVPLSTGAPEGSLWLLTAGRLARLHNGSYQVVNDRIDLTTAAVPEFALLADPRGQVYLGSWARVEYVEEGRPEVRPLGRATGLHSEGATALFVDREGLLWIASNRGVSKIASRRFASYRAAQGLREDEVTAICEVQPDVLAFGHNRGLSFVSDRSVRTIDLFNPTARSSGHPRVMDLQPDGRGGMWAAAADHGIAHIQASGRIEWYGADRGIDDIAWSVALEPSGRVWAVHQHAVLVLDPGSRSFRPVLTADHGVYRRVVLDASGTVRVATLGLGVLSLRGTRWVASRSGEPPGNDVFAVFQDRRGVLWAGTSGGLYVVDGELLRRPAGGPDIRRRVFFAIEDPAGELWFGTDNGVVRWNGNRQTAYGVRQGLAGWEANRAAALVDSRGRLWIGTNLGASRYQPHFDQDPVPVPLVALSGVDVDGVFTPFPGRSEIELDGRSPLFRFEAVSFLDERSIAVRSRLDGFEANWTPAQPAGSRQLRFTNLPPGRFRLLLQARNPDGAWSPVVASPPLVVPTPVWRRGWVVGVLALGAGALVFAAGRYRQQQVHARRLREEVRLATERLEESEGRYRQVFESAGIAKVLVDPGNGAIRDANAAACAFYGLPKPDLLSSRASDIVRLPIDSEEIGAVVRGERPSVSLEATHTLPSGERRDVEIHVSLTTIRKTELLLAIVVDVTDRKRAEEALRRKDDELRQAQRLETVGRLAGGVAHDFNNSLQAMLALIQLLRVENGKKSPPALAELEDQVKRAASLTRQLLLFARREVVKFETLDLNEAVAASVRLVRRLVRENIEFSVRLAPVPLPTAADRGQIDQVVVNLVVNAADAMPAGGRLVVCTGGDEREVWLDVEDTGHGIGEDVRARIFEPFFTTKEAGRGTGLGLSVAQGIASAHGGRIELRSEVGAGSRFRVVLPRRTDAAAVPPVAPEPGSAELPGARGERVLVVEDEHAAREGIAAVLRMLGYDVVTVATGEDALAVPLEPRVDLLISDIVLPGMHGDEVVAALTGRWSDLQVILMSGYTEDVALKNRVRLGHVRFLQKPFDMAALAHEARQALDSRG